jgi:hypothetical protein
MTDPHLFREELIVMRPVMTRCSLQSQTGDFLTSAAAQREVELKRQWMDVKTLEEAREAAHRAEVEARLNRQELSKIQMEAERDQDLVDWDENDPENPQLCESFLIPSNASLTYFRFLQTQAGHHRVMLPLDYQCYIRIFCSIFCCKGHCRAV